MGILVIVIATIPESFQIIICYISNFILEFFVVVSLAPCQKKLFICIFVVNFSKKSDFL